MQTRQEIVNVVFSALESLNRELPATQQIPVALDTRLFGDNAALDSLSLVSVIVDVESNISDTLGVSVSLTDDRAMGQAVSPFKDVNSLVDYIQQLLAELKR